MGYSQALLSRLLMEGVTLSGLRVAGIIHHNERLSPSVRSLLGGKVGAVREPPLLYFGSQRRRLLEKK